MNPNAALAIQLGVCPIEVRSRETLRTGLNALDTLTGGFPRGGIVEITGPESSGRATLANSLLAASTRGREICALVDTHDSFDPAAAAASGVALAQLVWIRCGGHVEHAFQAADALLHAGGFGVVAFDLCRISNRAANRIPLSYWHRFRHAVENTPAILAVFSHSPHARSCAVMQLELRRRSAAWPGAPGFALFRAMEIGVAPRKPARPQQAGIRACVGF